MKKWKVSLTALAIALFATGCANYGARNADDDYNRFGYDQDQIVGEDIRTAPRKFAYQRDNVFGNPGETEDRMGRNVNPNLVTGDGQWNRGALAERLADAAAAVKGVDDANVVIMGDNVYVGLELSEGLPAQRSDEIHREVLRKLYGIAPEFDIRISSDKDLFGRVNRNNNR